MFQTEKITYTSKPHKTYTVGWYLLLGVTFTGSSTISLPSDSESVSGNLSMLPLKQIISAFLSWREPMYTAPGVQARPRYRGEDMFTNALPPCLKF